MRKDMKQCQGLVSKHIPITTELYGDDLEGSLKKIEQLDKLKDTMKGPSTSTAKRFHPYSVNKFHQYKDKARHF